MEKIKLHDKTFKVMIPASEIDAAVERVAKQLDERYKGRTPIFLGVLSGSFLFLSDLVRKISFNSQVAFVKISSYEGTESSGEVKQQLGIDFDIEGRDVIIVEDIVETGHSMNYLLDYLKRRKPASISICTLFFKPEKFLSLCSTSGSQDRIFPLFINQIVRIDLIGLFFVVDLFSHLL